LATPLPTTIFIEQPTTTPTLTETPISIPTNTSTTFPTLEPISGGWSTFRSSEYGFSFQYPSVYDKGFYNPLDKLSMCGFQSGKDDNGGFNVWIGLIHIIVNKESRDLDAFSDSYFTEKKMKWDITNIDEASLDEISAISFDYGHGSQSTFGYETIAVHNQNSFIIDYYQPDFIICDPLDSDYSSGWVQDQIVNTWKFEK
jgi:hypothetical protein